MSNLKLVGTDARTDRSNLHGEAVWFEPWRVAHAAKLGRRLAPYTRFAFILVGGRP